MVQNVKKKASMSIVEIMVTMVILSIVALIMANMLTLVSQSQSKSEENHQGYLMAKHVVQVLQDTSTTAAGGSDCIVVRGITYHRTWTISNTSTPYRVDVTVTWTGKNNQQREIEFSSYLPTTNACHTVTEK